MTLQKKSKGERKKGRKEKYSTYVLSSSSSSGMRGEIKPTRNKTSDT